MDIHVGTTFDNIIEAKTIIKAFAADTAESWKSTHSDKERFNIVCKQQRSCAFLIRATNSKKKGVSITHLQLILATQQATLELLIQTLQSIFFPIIKQLYKIT
jgi:environmental stress-induced protein Ves